MRNQVTVIVSIPWIENISKSDYKNLYDQILSIAHNESSVSHAEANHLISGMTQRKKTYSYDASPDEINFQSYANLSQYVPDKVLTIQVGKVGAHVQTGPRENIITSFLLISATVRWIVRLSDTWNQWKVL